MSGIKSFFLAMLLCASSPIFACAEESDGKRISPNYPILGMSQVELSAALEFAYTQVGKENIISISPHNPRCLYIQTGSIKSPLNGAGKSYIFIKENGKWVLSSKGGWLS